MDGRTESSAISVEKALMQDMLFRVREVNYMPEEVRETVLDFTVDGVKLGKVGENLVGSFP